MIYKEDCYFFLLLYLFVVCVVGVANIFASLSICPVVVRFPGERAVFPGALEHYSLN